jgi:hypothetical protein
MQDREQRPVPVGMSRNDFGQVHPCSTGQPRYPFVCLTY